MKEEAYLEVGCAQVVDELLCDRLRSAFRPLCFRRSDRVVDDHIESLRTRRCRPLYRTSLSISRMTVCPRSRSSSASAPPVYAFTQAIAEVVIHVKEPADDRSELIQPREAARCIVPSYARAYCLFSHHHATAHRSIFAHGSIRALFVLIRARSWQLRLHRLLPPSLTTANFNGCIAFQRYSLVPTRPPHAHHRRRNRLRRPGRRRLSRGDRQ